MTRGFKGARLAVLLLALPFNCTEVLKTVCQS